VEGSPRVGVIYMAALAALPATDTVTVVQGWSATVNTIVGGGAQRCPSACPARPELDAQTVDRHPRRAQSVNGEPGPRRFPAALWGFRTRRLPNEQRELGVFLVDLDATQR